MRSAVKIKTYSSLQTVPY